MERIEPLRVKTPSSIIMVGPSGCGKTCFTESLLSRHHQELFVNTTSVIVYCYVDWQDKFRSMKKGGVKFHEARIITIGNVVSSRGCLGTGRFNVMKEETIKKSWTFLDQKFSS